MMHVSVPVGATLSVSSNHVVHVSVVPPAESSQMMRGLKRVRGGGWGECYFIRNRGEYSGLSLGHICSAYVGHIILN